MAGGVGGLIALQDGVQPRPLTPSLSVQRHPPPQTPAFSSGNKTDLRRALANIKGNVCDEQHDGGVDRRRQATPAQQPEQPPRDQAKGESHTQADARQPACKGRRGWWSRTARACCQASFMLSP